VNEDSFIKKASVMPPILTTLRNAIEVKQMKKKLIPIGILVALIIFGSVAFTSKGRKKKKNDDRIEVARRGEFIVKLRESGNLEPLISVEVKSNVYGEVEQLFVEDGDFVERSQPLLQIDDRQIREQKIQAEADLSAAEAQLQQAKKRTNLTQDQQTGAIKDAADAVENAQLSLTATLATSKQLISQAETEIESTKTALSQDEIALQQAQITLKQAELSLGQLESALHSALTSRDNAQSELERNQELNEKKLVSKKALEDAQARHANAQSEYDSAQNRVESQQETIRSHAQSIESRKTAIEMRKTTLASQQKNIELLRESRTALEAQTKVALRTAQTRFEQIQRTSKDEKAISEFGETSAQAAYLRVKSSLENAKEQLEWTTIKAPMSGTITLLNIEEGELVTSSRSAFSSVPPIMTIADLSKMQVKTWVNEVDVRKVKVGQTAEIHVEAYRDRKFAGKVSKIAPSGQPQQNVIKFEVEIEVVGSPEELQPGMTADVNIIVVNREDVLQLPIEAVIDEEVVTVKATVADRELSRLKTNQSVEVENLAGARFKGKIGSIHRSKARENVEILLDKGEQLLRSGPMEISIVLSDTEGIERLEAFVESEEKHFVRRFNAEDSAKAKKGKKGKNAPKGEKILVGVGERNTHNIEIKHGVQAGDRVIVQPIGELIKNGMGK
jgi:multidrug efflux pump subunit AcrA (membrane-fusion protein)